MSRPSKAEQIKYLQTACLSCSRNVHKGAVCDSEHPICGNCSAAGCKCEWGETEELYDQRRKASAAQHAQRQRERHARRDAQEGFASESGNSVSLPPSRSSSSPDEAISAEHGSTTSPFSPAWESADTTRAGTRPPSGSPTRAIGAWLFSPSRSQSKSPTQNFRASFPSVLHTPEDTEDLFSEEEPKFTTTSTDGVHTASKKRTSLSESEDKETVLDTKRRSPGAKGRKTRSRRISLPKRSVRVVPHAPSDGSIGEIRHVYNHVR